MPFKVYEDTDVDKFLLMSDVMGMEVLRSLSVVLHEKEEESEAEEVIAGAIFSKLLTEAMFEQGPPWLKQWINFPVEKYAGQL